MKVGSPRLPGIDFWKSQSTDSQTSLNASTAWYASNKLLWSQKCWAIKVRLYWPLISYWNFFTGFCCRKICDIFLIFPRKQILTFHTKCHLSFPAKQITEIPETYFLRIENNFQDDWAGSDLIKLSYFFYVFGQTGLSKQCRLRSDAAECGIWSGSTLFATDTAILHIFVSSKMDLLKKIIR